MRGGLCRVRLHASILSTLAVFATAQSSATIPSYVLQYAPLIYLDVNELYYPSDIAAQVTNTYPAVNFTEVTNRPSNLSLSDLTEVNAADECTSFSDCDVYLTSKQPVPANPPYETWLYGVEPNPSTGETVGATSCAVIVTDHGNNTVDAYYMYFYAFNRGVPVGGPNGTYYDNHVGDWEHNMIRFSNGQPLTVYYSIHSTGAAISYDATIKNGSRPLGFASSGGHATYPTEGIHVMYAGAANDSTSRGPLWDPVAGSGAWYYTFTPASATNFTDFNGTFTAVNVEGRTARGVGPTDWLHFYGRWGDKQYNSSYPGQQSIGSLTSVFEDGPTGPLDKDLYRSEACPDSSGNFACITTSTLQPASGTPVVQTVSRSSTATPSGTTTRAVTGSSSSPTASPGAAPSLTSDVRTVGLVAWISCLWWSWFV